MSHPHALAGAVVSLFGGSLGNEVPKSRQRLHWFGAAFAASLIISACGGSPTSPDNTCKVNCSPPPVDTSISASIVSPQPGATLDQTYASYPKASVTIQASATSNIAGTISYSWIVDSLAVSNTSDSLIMLFAVGSHTVQVTATLGTKSSTAKTTFTVVPVPINVQVYVTNLDGSAHVFSNEYAVLVDRSFYTPLDSVLLSSSGAGVLTGANLLTSDTANVVIRGDTSLEWFAQQIPQAYWSNLKVLISPRNSVTIPTGSYAGTVFPISIGAPYVVVPSGPPDNTGYYFEAQLANGSYLYYVGDWKTTPIPVVLNGAASAADTAKVLVALDSMSTIFGKNLFALASAATASQSCGITLNLNQSNISDGMYEISSDFCNGVVNLGVPDSLWSTFGTWILQAETMHTLGAGHTCQWVSIMQSSCTYTNGSVDLINSGDVAYTLLLWRFRDMERQYNTYFDLGGNYAGWSLRNGQVFIPTAIP